MEKKNLTCIGCPMGCQITVEVEGEDTVTSTVTVTGGEKDRCSVKTKGNIPKEKIFACMEAINHVLVAAPVRIGDVVIENVCGTGVDVVATKNVDAA